MAARHVLSRWQKSQKTPQEAYTNLYTALRKNNMNQWAADLKQMVEGVSGTPEESTCQPEPGSVTTSGDAQITSGLGSLSIGGVVASASCPGSYTL